MSSTGPELSVRGPGGGGTSGRPAQAARRAVNGPAFTWLGRSGLAARGVVFGVIGVLALKLALGSSGGRTLSQRGALETIGHQPLGVVLLVIVALGLAGYATWRLVGAIEPSTAEDRKLQHRIAAAGSGIAYLVIFVTAVKILVGSPTSSGSGSARRETAGVLGWPAGPELVAIAGLVLIGIGVYQGYKAIARKFLDTARTEQMGPGVRRAYTAAGVGGHLARSVVFVLIGYGVIKAAIDFSPQKAIGLDGALAQLARSTYGPWLLGLVAVGLIGFAVYSLADARYRRI